jgi:ubiquinone/menaquinone biosynthesis C-methylase UbiE
LSQPTQSKLQRPSWQLPPGVSRGTWDYCNTPDIAKEYDQFHAAHPLLDFDQQWIADQVSAHQVGQHGNATLLDLGCGTGRAMVPWYSSGWRTIGFDLSTQMLLETQSKLSSVHSTRPSNSPGLIHGNLAQLDCIASETIDVAICLYSSIGMIRGRENRRSMIKNVRRTLRSNGLFVVHCHNRGMWLREPGGVMRTAKSFLRSLREREWEHGDRIYPYRGLPSMFLHIFTRREMLEDLKAGGFRDVECLALNDRSSGPLSAPSVFANWRAGGFLFCAKTSSIGERL